MVSAAQLAVFLPAAALVAVSPGANNVLAMQHAMRFGVGEAVIALAGRLTRRVDRAIGGVSLGLAALLATTRP